MRTFITAFLLIALLAIGGGVIAQTAYQAGVSTAVTTAVGSSAPGAVVVAPPYAYGYGYGWHPFGFGFGFGGIFGILGTVLLLFLIFGLIRALVFGFGGRRRGWGSRGGWGPGGQGGPGMGPGGGWDREAMRGHWEQRVHGTFDDWHRQAHDAPPAGTAAGPTAAAGPSTSPTQDGSPH